MTTKRARCKKGTRKNKKTGNCESVLDHTCSICLDRIVSGNVKTKCKHNFHKKCLIGWCKSQSLLTAPPCPICRRNIKDTCKKIMPFDSHEVFRFIPMYGEITDIRKEQIETIIKHKDFDVNVKQYLDYSIVLYTPSDMSHTVTFTVLESLLATRNSADLVEYLLKQPGIEIKDEVVSKLISSRSDNMLKLFKKYKKIPKSLKNLI